MLRTPSDHASWQVAYQTPAPRVVVVVGFGFLVDDVVAPLGSTVVVVVEAVVTVVSVVAGCIIDWPVTATATMGDGGGVAPSDPKNGTLPKEKIPPSWPTIR